jgi:hypothetical protein
MRFTNLVRYALALFFAGWAVFYLIRLVTGTGEVGAIDSLARAAGFLALAIGLFNLNLN